MAKVPIERRRRTTGCCAEKGTSFAKAFTATSSTHLWSLWSLYKFCTALIIFVNLVESSRPAFPTKIIQGIPAPCTSTITDNKVNLTAEDKVGVPTETVKWQVYTKLECATFSELCSIKCLFYNRKLRYRHSYADLHQRKAWKRDEMQGERYKHRYSNIPYDFASVLIISPCSQGFHCWNSIYFKQLCTWSACTVNQILGYILTDRPHQILNRGRFSHSIFFTLPKQLKYMMILCNHP